MWQQMRLKSVRRVRLSKPAKSPRRQGRLCKKAKAAAKKAARKKAAPKAAAVDDAGEPAPVTNEAVVSDASVDETQRAPISSVPQDVIEVGEAKPEGRKRGWWSRG